MITKSMTQRKEREKRRKRAWARSHREHTRAAGMRYHWSHRKERLAASRRWYRANKDKNRISVRLAIRRRTRKLMEQVYDVLGHSCARCSFSDRRALQIDHLRGGGTKDMKDFPHREVYLRNVIKVGKAKYQILCANHNWIKRVERHEISYRT